VPWWSLLKPAGSSAPQACPLVEASPGDRRFGNYIDTASLPRVSEREKRWQYRLASRLRGTQSEGPAGPVMWVTGSLVARLTRCGRSMAIQRDRRRGSVDTMISSTSSRLASLRIASIGVGSTTSPSASAPVSRSRPARAAAAPRPGRGVPEVGCHAAYSWISPPRTSRRRN
jgi:hypothetical protein